MSRRRGQFNHSGCNKTSFCMAPCILLIVVSSWWMVMIFYPHLIGGDPCNFTMLPVSASRPSALRQSRILSQWILGTLTVTPRVSNRSTGSTARERCLSQGRSMAGTTSEWSDAWARGRRLTNTNQHWTYYNHILSIKQVRFCDYTLIFIVSHHIKMFLFVRLYVAPHPCCHVVYFFASFVADRRLWQLYTHNHMKQCSLCALYNQKFQASLREPTLAMHGLNNIIW